nr:hypothetical protein [Tanacetum cinerariifolium]
MVIADTVKEKVRRAKRFQSQIGLKRKLSRKLLFEVQPNRFPSRTQ